jgi:pantothenate synthetase
MGGTQFEVTGRAYDMEMRVVALLVCLAFMPATAQTVRRSVRAIGEGSVSVRPDAARVSVAVVKQAATAADAASQNATAASAVITAVRQLLGQNADVKTSSYSLIANYSISREGSPAQITDLFLDVEIVGHPIVRESDGVAMSSRNAYLNADERKAARCLSRSLHRADCLVRKGETSARAIAEAVIAELHNEPLAAVEYVTISDVETLEPLEQIRQSALLALSVSIGQARLIDNKVLLRSSGE